MDEPIEIPVALAEVISDLVEQSEINTKEHPKFRFFLTLVSEKDDGNIDRFCFANSGDDCERNIIYALAKNSIKVIRSAMDKSDKKTLSHPKPKQIANNYYEERSNCLDSADDVLKKLCKSLGFSYFLVVFADDFYKTSYLLERSSMPFHLSTENHFMGYVKMCIFGQDLNDLINTLMEGDEDDEDGPPMQAFFEDDDDDDDFSSSDTDNLDDDDDEFDKY